MTHEETKLRKRLNDFQNNLSTWKEELEKKTRYTVVCVIDSSCSLCFLLLILPSVFHIRFVDSSEMDELKVSLPKVQEELAQARASLPMIKEKEDRLMEEVILMCTFISI